MLPSSLPVEVPEPPSPSGRSPVLGKPSPPLLVMKFGGSSLAGAEHLKRVGGIVSERLSQRPVLVLSAMGSTTNNLLSAAQDALENARVDISALRAVHEGPLKELGVPIPEGVKSLFEDLERILSGISLLQEISSRTRDMVVSFGERLSVRVFAAYYNHAWAKDGPGGSKIEAQATDSWDIGMLTTSGSGSANSAFSTVTILPTTYHNIARNLKGVREDYSYVPVVTGYIAKDEKGIITTLGRDGSDLSATVIGAAVNASEVQIWKDVSGILTTDPRMVPAARPVEVITYEEAAELSTFGAKVVHPAAVTPAWLAKVPISVRNSTAPQLAGTRIVADLDPRDARSGRVVALSSKKGITMMCIRSTRMLGQHGFLAHVFQVFDQFQASVDVIATSEVTVSLTLDQQYKDVNVEGIRNALASAAEVTARENLAMLTLITAKEDSTEVMRECFGVFTELGVGLEMVSHGASNVNVTFILPQDDLLRSAQRIHEVFFER